MKKYLVLFSVITVMTFVFTACDKLDPNKPQACFVTPDEVIAGLPTLFNSSCSVNATSFSWDFGDGGSSTDANPMHTYLAEGGYTVTLTASNDAGKSDEQSSNVTVTTPSVIEHTGSITADETWIAGAHLITGDVYVDGATLTIQPGAVVMLKGNTGIYIGYHGSFSGGTLLANGTAQLPITFTSSAAIRVAGDWDYIGFYNGASDLSSMQYCVVEYGGGYSSNSGEIHIENCSVAIDHSTIRYSGAIGILLRDDGFFHSFTNNTLEENVSSPVSIYGNYVHTIGSGNNIVTNTGIFVVGDRVEVSEVTWLKQTCAYVIGNDLYVGSETGSKLVLNPGVRLNLGINTGIYIGYYSGTYGTLTAEGTDGEHIRFTSSAPDIAKQPGDWDYIGFYDGARSGSSLAYCDIEYGGGYSGNVGMISLDGSGISLTNSTISNSGSMGISMYDDGMFVACSNNTFGVNSDVPIKIYGNYVHTIGTGNTFNDRGILVEGDRIEQANVTWLKQNAPYIVSGDQYLGTETGAILTLEPGTTLKFTVNTGFYLGYYSGTTGILKAEGQTGNPITFTSGAPSGAESAGDWDGIWFYDGTANTTILSNCVIAYGGGYSSGSGNLNIKNNKAGVPEISNCKIENSATWGIYLDNTADPTLTNNTFANNASGNTNR